MTGRELKALRLRRGMTQEALGAELGVHRVTVNTWERGHRPIPFTYAKLSRFILLTGTLQAQSTEPKARKVG